MELESRKRLEFLLNNGVTNTETLVKITGVSRATVYNVKKRLRDGRGVNRKPGSGSPPSLQANDKRRISKLAEKYPIWTREEIAKEAHKRGSPLVSPWTVGRYLKSEGWLYMVPKPRPMLTEAHKKLRLAWCREHLNFDWSNVLFTDESYFQFYSNKKAVWTKGKATKMIPKYSPKVMIWGGIALRGTTSLCFASTSIKSQDYIKILEDFLPSAQALYPDSFWLQQDNARPHTARETKLWMANNGLQVMKWPAVSPDLNVIENVWGLMKKRLDKTEMKTVVEWKLEIEKIWDNLSHDYLKSLIDSMPRRVQMVIEANGDTIKY